MKKRGIGVCQPQAGRRFTSGNALTGNQPSQLSPRPAHYQSVPCPGYCPDLNLEARNPGNGVASMQGSRVSSFLSWLHGFQIGTLPKFPAAASDAAVIRGDRRLETLARAAQFFHPVKKTFIIVLGASGGICGGS